MRVSISFYSYFKELTGSARSEQSLAPGATLGELLEQLMGRFPKLQPLQRSMLVAVGVEYQQADYVLQEGDEVSLFPPVQGG